MRHSKNTVNVNATETGAMRVSPVLAPVQFAIFYYHDTYQPVIWEVVSTMLIGCRCVALQVHDRWLALV
jgi:hypothetical protein